MVDYPDVVGFRDTDDAWLVGNKIYVAPIPSGEEARDVLIPPGEWRDFYTDHVYSGPISIRVTRMRDARPIFTKDGFEP